MSKSSRPEQPLVPRPPNQSPVFNPQPANPAQPQPIAASLPMRELLAPCIARIGTLQLSAEESAALMEPFPEEVERVWERKKYRYIPHIEIRRRLNEVLGVGQWSLAQLNVRKVDAEHMLYAEFALVVRGVWMDSTVCCVEIPRNNYVMDYGELLECARGHAIRRLAAKCLSCGDQVWRDESAEDEPPQNAQDAAPEVPMGGRPPTAKGLRHQPLQEAIAAKGCMDQAAKLGSAACSAQWAKIPKQMAQALAQFLPHWRWVASEADRQAAAANAYEEGGD